MEDKKVEVLDENIKTEKKKSPVGLIILVVVLMIGCLVGGYFINEAGVFTSSNDKEEKEEKKDEENKNEKEEKLDIDNPLVINLFNIFRFDKSCWMNSDALGNDNKVKLRLAYDNTNIREYVECSKLGARINNMQYCGDVNFSDADFNDAYMNDQNRFNKLIEERSFAKSIKQSDLKAKVIELFGSDYDYKDEDFGIGHTVDTRCAIMHYVESEKVYAEYNGQCGGTCGPLGSQEILKAYKLGEKLYIETKITYDDDQIKDYEVIYEFKKDKENGNYVFSSSK